MRPAAIVVPVSLFLLATGASCNDDACSPARSSEPCDIKHAQAMADGDSLLLWPAAHAGKPVVLYVDRSQSMRGFLDPEYPARIATDYRSVLDGFDARLRPAQVFGYGNEVRPAEGGGLGVLGDREFYADGNTELEEVFPLIQADSALGTTHVIIGDGRRGDPDAANGQYVALRGLAEQWTGMGGTFIVASSEAPFRPVENDPAGCRASEDEAQTCPLYAFAFVAPGDQGRVAETLAAVFQNLYVTPLPAVPGPGVRMTSPGTAEISLAPSWSTAADGTPIARSRGQTRTVTPMPVTLALKDTVSPRGRAVRRALRGQRLEPVLAVRTLMASPEASPWRPSPATGSLMRPTDDVFAYHLFSGGEGPSIPRYLYRLQLHPAGEPSWLEAFDAESAGDARRTYGLGRLFESFSSHDPQAAPPVIRGYVVVN